MGRESDIERVRAETSNQQPRFVDPGPYGHVERISSTVERTGREGLAGNRFLTECHVLSEIRRIGANGGRVWNSRTLHTL